MGSEENEASRKAGEGTEAPDREALFGSLHVCKELSGNGRFHPSGNGLGPTFAGSSVLWFQGARRQGAPSSRTKKSEAPSFAQQDAVDALLAFANIAERVAPFCWANDPLVLEPEHGECGEKGGEVLRKEVDGFVDRYGLPHMRSDGRGPGTRKNPLEPQPLFFIDDYKGYYSACTESKKSFLGHLGSGRAAESFRRGLESEGLFVEGDKRLTSERIYFDGMRRFAKDFSDPSGMGEKICALAEKEMRLESDLRAAVRDKYLKSLRADGSIDKAVYDGYRERESRCRDEIRHLHLEEGDLLHSCERAYGLFTADERDSLSSDGYVEIDICRMYRISLLFHDALELYMAINGDEAAFNRVLGKIHMEVFEVGSVDAEDEYADKEVAEAMAAERYTIWFESCGSDPDNPGSNMDYSSYATRLSGCRLKLSRQEERAFEDRELYGCGRAVHVLCEPGETPENFRPLARKYMRAFLDGLIEEGVTNNYKGQFAEAGKIDPAKPLIDVNDFGTDLVRTLWEVMSLISKGEITIQLAHCEFCRKLMNVARGRGTARKVCDASCRGRLHKSEKSGAVTDEEKIRRAYRAFAESEDAVHIGVISHMGPEMQPEKDEPGFLGKVGRGIKSIIGR